MNRAERISLMKDIWAMAEEAEEGGDLKASLMLNVAGNILYSMDSKEDAETLIKKACDEELANDYI